MAFLKQQQLLAQLGATIMLLFLIGCGEGDDDSDPPESVSISVNTSGNGSGLVVSEPSGIDCGNVCQASFDKNSGDIVLTASANSDSVFLEWQGDCQGSATCVLESNQDQNVTAIFEKKVLPKISFSVSLSGAGGGNVTSLPAGINCGDVCDAEFEQSESSITLTATPDSNSEFVEWQGDCQGSLECSLTANADRNVVAVFATKLPPMINLSVSKSGNGQGLVSSTPVGLSCGDTCEANFEQNSGEIVLSAEPDDNSLFVRWEGDCQGTEICTLSSQQNASVTATFELKPLIEVESMTLINADTDLPIDNYDPLISGSNLDLATLPSKSLNLRVNASDAVESVRISIDGTEHSIENQRPFSLGDNGNGDYSTWPLTLGEHTIVVEPFSEDNAQGTAGESQTLIVTLLEAKWSFSQSSLQFSSKTGEPAASAKKLTLSNLGNVDIDYTTQNIPDWLTVSPSSQKLLKGESQEIEFEPAACTQDGRSEASITFLGASLSQIIEVTRVCSATASIDFVLERFYISQSVPSMDTAQESEKQVELILGRSGLGRAFVSSNETTDIIPDVVLNYRLPDNTTGQVSLTKPSSLSSEVDESNLNDTFNAELASDYLKAGIEFYVEIDPDNSILEIDENNNRLPEEGYFTPEVFQINTFNITFVPITYNGEPAGDVSEARLRNLLAETYKTFPMVAFDVVVHEPIEINDLSWEEMLSEVNQLRRAEGSSRAYHGIVKSGPGSYSGIGYIGHLVAVSQPYQGTINHEFGHNFGLPHAPCGVSGDPDYPYSGGVTGVWGYDLQGKVLKSPERKDLMSYCGPTWVSDYNYKKVAKFHADLSSDQVNRSQSSTKQTVLLVSGTVDSELLSIETVFSLETKALANEKGDYVLRGFDKNGNELFTQSFKTYALSHKKLEHFSVSIALSESVLNNIDKLEVSLGNKVLKTHRAPAQKQFTQLSTQVATQAYRIASEKTHTVVRWDAQTHKAVMVRDPLTQQIIGIDKSGQLLVHAKGDKIEVIYSDGLHSHSEIISVKIKGTKTVGTKTAKP